MGDASDFTSPPQPPLTERAALDRVGGEERAIQRILQVKGRRYSIRLEPIFWRVLEELSAADGIRLNAMVRRIAEADALDPAGNLTSRLRVHCARELRQQFQESGTCVVSLVSSPGSGKTRFLEQTLTLLRSRFGVAALVGDLATENDARRLSRAEVPVKQITTGTVCHLEAEMVRAALAEWNIGQLSREEFGEASFRVGFGTHEGTVAAATDWGGPMEVKSVRPSHERSYERVCHDSGVEAFLLHLREPARTEVREELIEPRLERAIGVIYRPETELASHYFQAVLPFQFDEWIWFDRTEAVRPLAEQRYDVRRWTEYPRGGHFAALEVPELLAADLIEFFGS